MTAEEIARQWRAELGAPHTEQARARGELFESFYAATGAVIGFVDYHLRRDGQLTIYSIAMDRDYLRMRGGTQMLEAVRRLCPTATSILAKCVEGNAANGFFSHMGFTLERVEEGKRRRLNIWRLTL